MEYIPACMVLYASGPVCYITLQEGVLYWSSHGSVSSYGVKISDDKRVLLENATTEQVLILPTDVVGKFSVEVLNIILVVHGMIEVMLSYCTCVGVFQFQWCAW